MRQFSATFQGGQSPIRHALPQFITCYQYVKAMLYCHLPWGGRCRRPTPRDGDHKLDPPRVLTHRSLWHEEAGRFVDAYRVQDITNTSLSARIRDGSIIARVRHERDRDLHFWSRWDTTDHSRLPKVRMPNSHRKTPPRTRNPLVRWKGDSRARTADRSPPGPKGAGPRSRATPWWRTRAP
jgi:hypothetical protein